VDSPRAILFDLDDTLYPYRSFVRSGFRAIGRFLADRHGLSAVAVVQVLGRSMAGGRSGREVQTLCEHFDLPDTLVPTLVAIIRDQQPRLRLPRESARVLAALRSSWRVAVLTNGDPAVQRRKLAALGVADLVDAALCAVECGDPRGKPAPVVFLTALDRLGVAPSRAVFVGDDMRADIEGARVVGMKTIHMNAPGLPESLARHCGCPVHLQRLSEVPAVAEQLMPSRHSEEFN
jgi:putative hydrolase of the HAD superfamily